MSKSVEESSVNENYLPPRSFSDGASICVDENLYSGNLSQVLKSAWFEQAKTRDLIELFAERVELHPYNSDLREFLNADNYTEDSAKEFLSEIKISRIVWGY